MIKTSVEALLERKAEQLQAELIAWAHAQGILLPGDTIVFSLRIDTSPVVRRDEADALLVHRLRVIGRELIEANRWPDL